MSYTTKARQGTVFIHNGDYSGDVMVSVPATEPAQAGKRVEVCVPFADLRELVFDHLRARRTEWLEQASDDELEAGLLR